MKMKKGRKLISMLMLLTVMVSAPATSVHADSVNRIGTSKVGTITQAYTGGNSQVYAHLITKADGTEVRYIYSKNYLNIAASAGAEDSFAALKSVLTADYATLIPDSVDASRNGNEGFFFCSDSSLEEHVNNNWTSAEYVARNVLSVQKEGTSYAYKCEGDGAGGAIDTSATAARQSDSNRFELVKRLAEEENIAKWETKQAEMKAAWDAAEAVHHSNDSTYTPQEYVGSEYVPLDFGTLTGANIQGKRDLTDNQIELAVGCNDKTSYEFEGGKLYSVTNITIIERIANIYSEHVTISASTEPHNHDIKKLDAKEPTCTENGYKEHYECTECGMWFEDQNGHAEITDKSSYTLKATGHKWDRGEITKEATYDEAGIRTYTCLNDPSHTKEEAIYLERERDTDNSDDSSGGSGNKPGSVSKQSIDIDGNIIPTNHQAETGVAVSDTGGIWANDPNTGNWTYTKSDGTPARGEWLSLDYNGLRYWYYFNETGNMVTNWFDYNGERFYLVPDRDGWRGRMATGWKNIDNKWYYFEIVPGTSQGKMYRSTVTPDGHVVGADGAWDGVGETPVGQV